MASRYSWISLLGFVVFLASVTTGLGVGGSILSSNDEALIAGMFWGAFVGLGLGASSLVSCSR